METTGSKSRKWIGWTLSIIAILFMTMDGVMKLIQPEVVLETTLGLGYPQSTILPMGIIALICTALYAIPKTTVLGAVLLTGFLGGAIATHFRLEHELLSETLFPIYVGILIWGGLFLRYPALINTFIRNH